MPTLLDELVTSALQNNPYRTREELEEGLVQFITQQTLSQSIKHVNLPQLMNPVQLKYEELRISRYRKSRRDRELNALHARQRLIKNIEKLQGLLNGYEVSNNLIPNEIPFQHATTEMEWRDAEVISDITIKPPFLQSDVLTQRPTTIVDTPKILELPPSNAIRPPKQITKLIPIITLDQHIQEKIVSKPTFRNVIKDIEKCIRSKDEWRTYDFHFSIEKDIELPTWEKTILTIYFKKISFDYMMKLWDEIDLEIRKSIIQTKNQYETLTDQIDEINTTLFTSAELIEVTD
jgi:hypothetical protein